MLLEVHDLVLELGLLSERRRLVDLELRNRETGVDDLLLLALDVLLEVVKLLVVEGEGGALLVQLRVGCGVLALRRSAGSAPATDRGTEERTDLDGGELLVESSLLAPDRFEAGLDLGRLGRS